MENKYRMLHIEKNCVVLFRYIMKNKAGEVLENTMNDAPVSYVHGSTGIQPLLQSQLEGMKAGDKKTIYLTASSGLVNDDFIFEIIVDEVSIASEEEIIKGYSVKEIVQSCDANCSCHNQASMR